MGKVNTSPNVIKLSDAVGKHYKAFWDFRGRYVVCKGSRASKKSVTAALWVIYHMMRYPLSNTLVIRRTARTLKDSCYTTLKWAINRLGVDHLWQCKLSPLEMIYKPTGQRILFRGTDDPLKVTSISVDVGVLNFMWIEEAYELMKEEDFNMLDESIRGQLPDGYFRRVMLTFNPWSDQHWIKKRFFDVSDPNVLAMTTNYLMNEFLDPTDFALFEDMKRNRPKRYEVAGLGNWGIVDGLVYERWKEESFTLAQLPKDAQSAFGLDFGYTNDPSALFCGFVSLEQRKLYVWDEMYKKGLSNRKIADTIISMGYGKERITADSAEPKSIDELKTLGLRVHGALKGKDSIQNGIQWIQDLEIIIHPRCVNFITEISNYTWDQDKFGAKLNVPIDDFNHLMDAMRYALESMIARGKVKAARRF